MTRGQLEDKFPKDGGRQSISPVRFTHPACGYFKIDVAFAVNDNRTVADKSDQVTKVSKPYIEEPFSE